VIIIIIDGELWRGRRGDGRGGRRIFEKYRPHRKRGGKNGTYRITFLNVIQRDALNTSFPMINIRLFLVFFSPRYVRQYYNVQSCLSKGSSFPNDMLSFLQVVFVFRQTGNIVFISFETKTKRKNEVQGRVSIFSRFIVTRITTRLRYRSAGYNNYTRKFHTRRTVPAMTSRRRKLISNTESARSNLNTISHVNNYFVVFFVRPCTFCWRDSSSNNDRVKPSS